MFGFQAKFKVAVSKMPIIILQTHDSFRQKVCEGCRPEWMMKPTYYRYCFISHLRFKDVFVGSIFYLTSGWKEFKKTFIAPGLGTETKYP